MQNENLNCINLAIYYLQDFENVCEFHELAHLMPLVSFYTPSGV